MGDLADDPVMLSGELLDAVATWDALSVLDRVPTRETAAVLHRMVVEAKRNLTLAEDVLADFLLDVCGSGRMELDGVGVFEVKVGKDRKEWDHAGVVRDLIPAIVERLGLAMAVTGDGVRVEPTDAVRSVIESFRESSSDGWKVTGLRDMGLDPDDYCRSSRGRVSVQWA